MDERPRRGPHQVGGGGFLPPDLHGEPPEDPAALDAYVDRILDEEPWAVSWTRPLLLFREAPGGAARANVPRVAAHHVVWRHGVAAVEEGPKPLLGPGGSPYEWGAEGALTPRGLELALAVLNAYVRPGADGLEPQQCAVVNVASATAMRLHERFAAEVLARVPRRGAEIPYREIAAWIESRAPWLPEGTLPGER